MATATRSTLTALALGRGRSPRMAFCIEILYVLGLQAYFDHYVPRNGDEMPPALALISIVATWLLLSATARRAHDIGVPGWAGILFLLLGLGTALNLILASGMQANSPVFALGVLTSLLVVGGLSLFPGMGTENRWGPPPRRKGTR